MLHPLNYTGWLNIVDLHINTHTYVYVCLVGDPSYVQSNESKSLDVIHWVYSQW